MDNAMISKIEKAKRYAEERERIQFQSFEVTIRGNNSTHTVNYDNGVFDHQHDFFRSHGFSTHTMAMERILKDMVSPIPNDNYTADSSVISKVEKAKRYAEERDRVQFQSFRVSIQGENSTHIVNYEENTFDCDCSFFQSRQYCSHTMAMERVLEDMIVSPGGAD